MSVEQIMANVRYAPVGSTDYTGPADASFAIEAIDETVLAALAEAQDEGEPDLIVELIDLYLDDAPQWVAAIRAAVAQADVFALQRAAHTLKGSSGSMGVRQVAEICRLIEQMNCDASAASDVVLLDLLDREFERARAALRSLRDRRIL